MVQSLLNESGKDAEFVNVTQLSFSGCRACVHRCARDNFCCIDDDLKPFYPKIVDAEAIVLGTPSYFNNINSFMAMFLERLWSFRHQRFPLKGKPFVAVAVGGIRSPINAIEAIKKRMMAYRAAFKGSVCYTSEIFPCYKCGFGHTCKVGSFYRIHGEEALRSFKITDQMFHQWEDEPEVVEQLQSLSQILASL